MTLEIINLCFSLGTPPHILTLGSIIVEFELTLLAHFFDPSPKYGVGVY